MMNAIVTVLIILLATSIGIWLAFVFPDNE